MKNIFRYALILIVGALFLSACSESAKEMAISVISPTEGATVSSSVVRVAGSVNRFYNVAVSYKLNGAAAQDATVDGNGAFAFDVPLTAGTNTIELTATSGSSVASKTLTLISQPVASAGLVVSSKTTADGPKITRPDLSGRLDDANRTSSYDALTFSVSNDGWYGILSEQDYDGYLLLYKDAFDPKTPVKNLIAVNDDFGGSFDEARTPKGISRILSNLKAGIKYILVTTAYGDLTTPAETRYGSFKTTIGPSDPPPAPFVLPQPRNDEYNITVRFLTNNITAEQQAVFVEAANRWSAIIKGDLPNIEFKRPVVLQEGTAPFVGILDDVIIDASFVDIDGPGRVLGRAGPWFVRTDAGNGHFLTTYGVMQFDVAEFGKGGIFEDPQVYIDTITHEMGHVLGIGTLWELTKNTDGILDNPPTVPGGLPNPDYDPRFIGKLATSAYQAVLAAAGKPTENSVPIANTGGSGNYNGHWRELTFDNELMTPYLGGTELLSTITAASLADMGYTVDMKSDAIDDGYKLPLPATFEQVDPNPKKYVEFTDFLKGSGSVGTVEAAVTAVDVKLDETADPKDATSNHPANSTSGCEAADFANFPKGNIALMQRGKCFFSTKADNAKAAGAVGIIIFNQGNTEARKSISPSTAADNAFPAIGIGFDLGKELATTAGLVVKISTPTHAQATIQTAALAPSYDEVVLQPIGTMAPDGKIRNFSGE